MNKMDETTKARYEAWKKKKILKLILMLVVSLILVGLLIFGLRQLNFGNENEGGNGDLPTEASETRETTAPPTATEPTLSDHLDIDRLNAMQDELEQLLNEMLNQISGKIGLSYYCLTTGRHIGINDDDIFFSASTIKLPTHMMIAESVEDGVLSWNQLLTVEEEHWFGGSGVLQHRINVGHELTLYEVMRHSIIYSDNIAHRMLTRALIPDFQHGSFGLDNDQWRLTTEVFNRYLSGEAPTGRMLITPNQLTEIFKVLYRDRDEIEGYRMILEQMMNTSWEDRFSTSLVEGIMAHTLGWADPYHHDSGIFFTDRPYILVIMTSGVADAPNFLSNISDLIFQFHLAR